jgi:hypothetical protein
MIFRRKIITGHFFRPCFNRSARTKFSAGDQRGELRFSPLETPSRGTRASRGVKDFFHFYIKGASP